MVNKQNYQNGYTYYDGGIHQHKWIHFIKHILISVGRPDLLNKEVIENPKLIKNQISKTLSDLYVQEWHNKVTSSSKGKNYSLFKQDLNFENYLIKLNRKHCSSLLSLGKVIMGFLLKLVAGKTHL